MECDMMGTLHHCLRAALGGHVARLRHWCRQGVRLPIEMRPGFYRFLHAGPQGQPAGTYHEPRSEDTASDVVLVAVTYTSVACVLF